MVDRRQALVVALCLVARAVVADPTGADSLVRGIKAFEQRDYGKAKSLFEGAIARGGLTRAQTLTAYIDLGATLVALHKDTAA
jgi:hypothetical protein